MKVKKVIKIAVKNRMVVFRRDCTTAEATNSFIISVSPSLSPHATTQLQLERLPENLVLSIF
jgi:uncharacterized membrane protein